MIDPDDLAYCRDAIRTGSYSFHAASRLLPARVRDPALALYAFCRLADDAVDEGDHKARAVLTLRDRLKLAYAGCPRNTPTDRAFAAIVEEFEMPRALPEALLEGLAWDARGDRYATLSEVTSYSARVASAVGAMMCVLMRVRDRDALARACDLGVAMQLTNIARDVGEDARAGRLYLPMDWFAEAGVDPDAFLRDPLPTDPVRRMVARLLAEARRLYLRAESGIAALPVDARTGIWAARLIYAAIGREIRRNGHDSVSMRARTGSLQKIALMGEAVVLSATTSMMPRHAVLHAPPLPETAYLVDAAARTGPAPQRTVELLDLMADLARRDRAGRGRIGA
ncbi:15-cis-phytoene synthase [Histidinibacterium aquaticum]|uniref:Phytoene/squalene synthase family protein n=1 Tax=Histidinibacterium aquaticum TaxID=2613962 RepID=A0A5J5GGI3_9RHOB|nr:phytoene/squalene synthase family protein [Histidinibacterium aquaticum]KAA9006843.1 phytoene/squalene synthase family protein [Histidinibacterium aquaticum]